MGATMRSAIWALGAAALLLSACGRSLHSLAALAEGARTATEQMVSASDINNDRRESRLNPEARTLRQGTPLKLSERYETREGPDGFMVYDTETHQIARLEGQSQSGMTYEDAQKAEEALMSADAKGQAPK